MRRRRLAVMILTMGIVAAAFLYKHFHFQDGDIGEPYIAFVEQKVGPANAIRESLSVWFPKAFDGIQCCLYYCDKQGRKKFVREITRSVYGNGDNEIMLFPAFICNDSLPYSKYKGATGRIENHWVNLVTNEFDESLPTWDEKVFQTIEIDDPNKTLLGIKPVPTNVKGHFKTSIHAWNKEKCVWEKVNKPVLNSSATLGLANQTFSYEDWLIFTYSRFICSDQSIEIVLYDYSKDKILGCYLFSIVGDEENPETITARVAPQESGFLNPTPNRNKQTTSPDVNQNGNYRLHYFVPIIDSRNSRFVFDFVGHFCTGQNCNRTQVHEFVEIDTNSFECRRSDYEFPTLSKPEGYEIYVTNVREIETLNCSILLANLRPKEDTDAETIGGLYIIRQGSSAEFVDFIDCNRISAYILSDDGALWYVRPVNPDVYKSRFAINYLTEWLDSGQELVRYDSVSGEKQVVHRGDVITCFYKAAD